MRISDWSSDVCSSDLEALADHRAHRTAHEGEIEGAGDQRLLLERALQGHQRVALAGALLRGLDPVDVLLLVLELEHVDRAERGADLLGAAGIEQRAQAHAGADRPVVVALRADLAVLLRSEEHTSELQSLMRLSYAV